MISAPDDAVTAALPRQRAADLTDLAVAGLYLPAGPNLEPIAGDFYDVLVLPDGLIALFVGDVSGHGEQAVGRMRALRATAKAYALQQPGPASVLARLDEYMGQQGPEELATLWYGEYRPGSGVLTYASAGHPPPAVTSHDGAPLLLDVTDLPPLGTGLAHAAAEEHRVLLPPGAVLIAYSDGLVERRDRDFGDQLALLTDVLRVACDPARQGTPAAIAAEILDALVPDPDQAQDDVCLLVVRRQLATLPSGLPRVGYVKSTPRLHTVDLDGATERARCGSGPIAGSMPGSLTPRTQNGCRECAALPSVDL